MLVLLSKAAHEFKPTRIAGCKLWLAADRVRGLADGEVVGSWPERASGWDFVQATAGLRPLYKTGIKNGRPALRFDNTDDLMLAPAGALGVLRNVAGATLFAVFAAPSQANRNVLFADNQGGATRTALGTLSSGTVRCVVRRLDGDVSMTSQGAGYTNGVPLLLSAVVNYAGASLALFKSGTRVGGTPSALTSGSTQDTSSVNLIVGTAAGNALNADVLEALLYNRALTAAERQRVEAYLGRKYGIQVNRPPLFIGVVAAVTPTLGAEQATGNLTAGAWYLIAATQANHFYTGCAVGQTFRATAATACDANNKVKALTLSTCLSGGGDAGSKNLNAGVTPIVPAGFQAGVMTCLNSAAAPTYYLHAYVDPTAGKAYLLKVENGVTTELVAGSITYVAGAELWLMDAGDNHQLYYNGVAVGALQSVSTAGGYGTLVRGFRTDATVDPGRIEVTVLP